MIERKKFDIRNPYYDNTAPLLATKKLKPIFNLTPYQV